MRVFIPAEPQPEFWAPSVVLRMDLKYFKPSSSPFSIPNKIMKANSVFVFSRGWNPSEFLQTGFRALLDAQCQAAAWEVPWDDPTAPCWNCVPSFPVPPEGTPEGRTTFPQPQMHQDGVYSQGAASPSGLLDPQSFFGNDFPRFHHLREGLERDTNPAHCHRQPKRSLDFIFHFFAILNS